MVSSQRTSITPPRFYPPITLPPSLTLCPTPLPTLHQCQEILNSENEETLIQGLQKAALQILREHGYLKPRKEENEGGEEGREGGQVVVEDDYEVSDDELDDFERTVEDRNSGGMEVEVRDEEEGEEGSDPEEEEEDDEQQEEEEEDDDEEEEDEEEASNAEGGEIEDTDDQEDEEEEGPSIPSSITHRRRHHHHLYHPSSTRERPSRHVTGLLVDYVQSSPQAIELSQYLWDLPLRQASRKVAEKHTRLLAVVLRCLRHTSSPGGGGAAAAAAVAGARGIMTTPSPPLASLLARRLLNDHTTDLHAQLISSYQPLATATLRLLHSLSRLSPAHAWEVLSRFTLTSKPVLHLFSPLSSHARPVAIALVSSFLRSRDPSLAVRILSTDRLLKMIFKHLNIDNSRTFMNWLAALWAALTHPRVPQKVKRRLVTSSRLEELRRVLGKGGREGGREGVAKVMREMIGGGEGGRGRERKRRVKKGGRTTMAVVRLLLSLSGSEEGYQQRLALALLEEHEDVRQPFMRRFNQTWEAKSNWSGLTSYVFVAKIVRACEGGGGGGRREEGGGEGGAERLLGGVLPSGMGKRELTKAVLSTNPLLARMGLLLTIQLLRRAQQAMGASSSSSRQQQQQQQQQQQDTVALRRALLHRLPDLQAVLAVKARCCTSSSSTSSLPPWRHHLLALVFTLLRTYHAVLPEAIHAVRFDFLRLVHDTFPPPSLHLSPLPPLLPSCNGSFCDSFSAWDRRASLGFRQTHNKRGGAAAAAAATAPRATAATAAVAVAGVHPQHSSIFSPSFEPLLMSDFIHLPVTLSLMSSCTRSVLPPSLLPPLSPHPLMQEKAPREETKEEGGGGFRPLYCWVNDCWMRWREEEGRHVC